MQSAMPVSCSRCMNASCENRSSLGLRENVLYQMTHEDGFGSQIKRGALHCCDNVCRIGTSAKYSPTGQSTATLFLIGLGTRKQSEPAHLRQGNVVR